MKKRIRLVSLCLVLCAIQSSARAQQKDSEKAQPPTGDAQQAAPDNPPQTSDRVYDRGEVDQKAVILSKPAPPYTEEARKEGVSGTVRVRMVLGADGEVREMQALTTLPYGLTKNALAASRLIRFRPAVKDGRPVSQHVTIEYNFGIIGLAVVGDEINKVYYRSGCAGYSRRAGHEKWIVFRNSNDAKKAGYKEAKTKCP